MWKPSRQRALRAAAAAMVAAFLCALGVAVTLADDYPCNWSSAGCSRINNTYPAIGSECAYEPGQACYHCEYACQNNEYWRCYEDTDQNLQYCSSCCDPTCDPNSCIQHPV